MSRLPLPLVFVVLFLPSMLMEIRAEVVGETEERIAPVVARFLGVPETLVQLNSVTEATRHQRPVLSCVVTVVTPDGMPVEYVRLTVDADALHVVSSGHRVLDEDQIAELAERFVRTNFPGWSPHMVLQYGSRRGENMLFRWVEKQGEVWTGTFVGMSVSLYRPGVPATYTAYVATPRSTDDIKVTEDQAVAIAQQFLTDNDYTGEIETVELHLDDLNRPFPHWWVTFQAKPQKAPADQPRQTTNVLIDAMSGEVVVPRVDRQDQPK